MIFAKLFHVAKIRRLAHSSASFRDIDAFLNNGVALNVIGKRKESSPSVASGIQRYSNYCVLTGVRYSPPPPPDSAS